VPARISICLAASLTLGAGTACIDTGPNTPLPDCTPGTAIQVGTGVRPQIQWTPQCGVTSLIVTSAAPLPDTEPPPPFLWGVTARAANFGPPVRYGTTPPGAYQYYNAAPLVRDSTYRVLLAYGPRDWPGGSDSFIFTVR
jgi:hypothetical protein